MNTRIRVVSVIPSFREFVFVVRLHKSTTPEGLLLDPVSFYKDYGAIPEGENHELEIVEPSDEFLKGHPLHVHHSFKDNLPMVCYPKPIPTISRAFEVLEMWCLGSACTIVHGVDLNTIYEKEIEHDESRFRPHLAVKYSTVVVQSSILSHDDTKAPHPPET